MSLLGRTQPVAVSLPAATQDTRLRGRALVLARAGWVVLVSLSLALFVASLSAYIAVIAVPCRSEQCILTPEQVQALLHIGTSPHALAVAVAVFYSAFLAISGGVAFIVFWRRSTDWMALLTALTLILYPISISGVSTVVERHAGALRIVGLSIDVLGSTLLYLLFTLFPSGRFVPRWLAGMAVLWAALHLVTLNAIATISAPAAYNIPDWLIAVMYLAFYLSIIGGQIYRYWRVSNTIQRQQTKWVVFGIVFSLLANFAYYQPYTFVPGLSDPASLYPIFGYLAYQVFTLAIPLTFGIAVLRFRLYDIDVIINRTLVYGSLTAILAAVYFAVVIGFQRVVGGLLGAGSSTLGIVISTLLVAALFNPLRHRLQRFIDRRFYRRKYDAAKTLAAFSATLRDGVDLTELNRHLVTVIDETMQPAHVSLWLAQPEQGVKPSPSMRQGGIS